MKTIPMQLKIEETMFQNIKRMARFQSVEKDKDVSWQDLVREALYNCFPIPKDSNHGCEKNIS